MHLLVFSYHYIGKGKEARCRRNFMNKHASVLSCTVENLTLQAFTSNVKRCAKFLWQMLNNGTTNVQKNRTIAQLYLLDRLRLFNVVCVIAIYLDSDADQCAPSTIANTSKYRVCVCMTLLVIYVHMCVFLSVYVCACVCVYRWLRRRDIDLPVIRPQWLGSLEHWRAVLRGDHGWRWIHKRVTSTATNPDLFIC